MDFATVQAQLNDLPPTFQRPGAPYDQLIDAFTLGLASYTTSDDATSAQMTFSAASYAWLDVWGLLFGIERNLNEAYSLYAMRIAFEVLAGGGPALQIEKWIQIVWQITATVTENLPNVGYAIQFPANVTLAQINQILAGLAYIRPAGVPFTVMMTGTGTVLDTINFLDAPDVIGAYLDGGGAPVAYTVGAATNNAVPLLPTLFLTDPTLNPGV